MKTSNARPIVGLSIALAAVILAWSAWGTHRTSAAQPPEPEFQAFGPFGIAVGQTAQINVVNPGLAQPPDPDRPVTVDVSFVDSGGSVQKQTTVDLAPGQSTMMSLNGDDLLRGSGRVQLRALVRFNQPPEPDRGGGGNQSRLPAIVSSVEVIDNATSRTSFVLQQPPEPDAQAFGMIGITTGQTAQINVFNPGLTQPPEPDRPLSVDISFVDAEGNVQKQTTVDLASGQSAMLSLNGDDLLRGSGRVQLRALVRLNQPPDPEIAGGGNQSRVPAIVSSVEVIDNATGRTSFVLTQPPEPERPVN
jgi:hypothetical protein